METRSNRRKMTEPIVDKIRRGEVSAFDALATELPDVFNAEILSKLPLEDALNLARVNKRYNDAVWSVDGVRAMKPIMEARRIPCGSVHRLGAKPMYFAARRSNVPAVRALLKSGVDIDEVVLEGSYTALQTATAWQSPEVVKLLIDAGADVNKRSVDFGMRPLHLAAQNGHVMIAMLLIKAGAEVNLADPTDGKTPLWFAVDSHLFDSHNMQMVSMLVRSGANVNIVPFDDDAMSPMEMAEDTECEGMLELLRLAPSLVSPPDVEPRFSVGDRVECCIERWGLSWWAPGTIVAHWFRTPDWPPGKYAPYQIKLNDSGNLVFAPEDRDDVIRLVGLTLRDVD